MALYPVQDTFVRGELSPRLHARASLDLYRAGLAKCENFLTLPHGGIRKRAGTYFVAEVKDSSKKVRLIPFVFSVDQAYCLEFGHNYLRVYAYGARVGSVELATPWGENDLADLMVEQSADVMWIAHKNFFPRKLTRVGHTNWTIEAVDFDDGPFSPVNTDETHQMYVSAATGTITITSDFDVFTAEMIDQLVRIDMEDYSNVKPWEPTSILKTVDAGSGNALGQIRRYNGNVYICDGSETTIDEIATGTTPPTHLKGSEWDGPNTQQMVDYANGTYQRRGVRWAYQHSGYGIGRITAYSSPTSVTAAVLARFPDEVVGSGNKSYNWRFGAFEAGNHANAVSLFEERLMFGRRFSVYGSKTGDFDSYRIGEKDDDALQFVQAGGGQANDIVWLEETDGALVIGTTGGVRALSGSGLDEALTPSSFKNRKSRSFGCKKIAPVDAGSSFMYVTRSGKMIAELQRDSTGRFQSEDISQISEHIPKKGVAALAFQNDPDPYLWFPLLNGELGGFTHQPSQEVRGMHRHRIGGPLTGYAWGYVESAVVTPGQTGNDDVWLIVKRTLNGVTKRYIEILQTPFEYGFDLNDSFFVDCGLTRSNGSPVNSVSGLAHLANQTVDALADSKVYRGLTVTATGVVSLPNGATASKWQVGLPYTGEAGTLELDVGGKDGSLIGRRKKVAKVILSVLETDTSGLEIASLIKGRWEPVRIPTVASSNGTVTLETRNIEVPIDDSWEGQGRVVIRHTHPTPCTIRAITPIFDSEP